MSFNWWERRRLHKKGEHPKAAEIGYVAAFSDPADIPLGEEEVGYSKEMECYMLHVIPIWYGVKDFINQEMTNY